MGGRGSCRAYDSMVRQEPHPPKPWFGRSLTLPSNRLAQAIDWLVKVQLHLLIYSVNHSHDSHLHLMHLQHQFQKRGKSGAILACFVGLVALSWDLEISRIFKRLRIPGDLNKAIQLSETFGHTAGVVAIFMALLLIDLENRPKLWRAAGF
ncbi:MAG: hypothetical protein ACOVLE_10435, partial [Pirellula staleyi]